MKKILIHQIILDMFEIEPLFLKDKNFLLDVLVKAAEKGGFTIMHKESYAYESGGEGASAIVLIGESHIAIHTWPEYTYAAADIESCKEDKYSFEALNVIIEKLKPKSYKIQEIKRPLK